MSGVAEKARFHLERSVPQLKEWEEKEVFSKDEIRTIVQKRNEHEHQVLTPRNKPSEWAAYARWEQSLEALRKKRCKRFKIQHLNSAHAGQNRVLQIYERGVTRHSKSATLWHEYLSYAGSIGASKRFRKAMTNALRMNPQDAQLWIMAGRRAAHNGDMIAARGFFMRGCRFCTKDGTLWIEYARCELEWLRKVDKRKEKPDADPLAIEPQKDDDDVLQIVDSGDEDDEDGENEDEDGVLLPEPSKAEAKVIDKKSAKQLQNNPAMDGAIPIAIFDISRRQAFFNANTAEDFFTMIALFRDVSAQPRISQHVLDVLDEAYPDHPATCNIHIRKPILGIDPKTAEFPRGLREALPLLNKYLEITSDRKELERKTVQWIDEYLAVEGLDEGIKTVLEHTKSKLGGS